MAEVQRPSVLPEGPVPQSTGPEGLHGVETWKLTHDCQAQR